MSVKESTRSIQQIEEETDDEGGKHTLKITTYQLQNTRQNSLAGSTKVTSSTTKTMIFDPTS